jgi:hypothetical protein
LQYNLKCEPQGAFDLTHEATAKALGLQGLSQSQQKLVAANVVNQLVSPGEAAMHMVGVPMVYLSTTVVVVSTAPPLRRMRVVTEHGRTTLASVTKYEMRPEAVRALTLYQFFDDHVLKHVKIPASPGEVLVGPSINSDIYGGYILYKRSPDSDTIVRYTDAHPVHQTETFFYNLLLRRFAFDKETDLLSEDNPDGSYYTEVLMRGIVTDEDSLLDAIAPYTRRHLLSKAKFAAHIEALIMQRDPCVPVVRLQPGEKRAPLQKKAISVTNSVLLAEFAWTHDTATYSLSAPQLSVVNAIVARPYGIHVIGGKYTTCTDLT